MAGMILAFKLKINFLNFIALPITFGIGVDYGVNVFQRYLLERKNRKQHVIIPVIKQTGGAVMLASLTTVIGYGSLVIASNQAFVSFGTLAVMGEITCITAAVLSLPAFLLYQERKRNK
jgi:predicted RND superfamily exporter protein